jgi:hypothetical protein
MRTSGNAPVVFVSVRYPFAGAFVVRSVKVAWRVRGM